MKKDYSLMRPFDQKAAKEGDSICWNSSDEKLTGRYLAGPDKSGDVAFEDVDGDLYVSRVSEFRMTPLCWVEGKPVYKGDVLWRNLGILGPERVTVDRVTIDSDGDVFLHYSNGGNSWVDGPDHMTTDVSWTCPKLKYEGWINVYRHNQNVVGDIIWDSKRNADLNECDNRVDCVRIEWEESAK